MTFGNTRAFAVLALAACCGAASAADSQNLNVSATVQAVCKFSSTVQTLSFGTLDPSVASNATGSGAAVTYKCTKGQAAAGVTAGDGNNATGPGARRLSNGTDFIPYTLSISGGTQTGSGFGSGQDKALTISGTVLGTDYTNVSAGNYTDVVVLSITP